MFERRKEAIGGWDLSLIPETPQSILDLFDLTDDANKYGHVCITPGRVSTLTSAAVLAASRYTGILVDRDELSLSGWGIEAWLSDPNDIGKLKQTATNNTDAFEDWFDTWETNGFLNGLTLGSIEALGGSHKLVERRGLVTIRPLIDRLCRLADAEWRVNPDGTIDAGSDLYGDPSVVLVRSGGSRDLNVRGLPVTDWGYTATNEEYTTGKFVPYPVAGIDDAAFESSTITPTSKRLDGANLIRQQVVDGNDSADDATSAQNIADKEQGRSGTRVQIAPSVDVYDLSESVQPGDTVYVYDPTLRLVNTANQLPNLGRVIFPTTTRVHAVRQPFRQGMRAYYRAPDATGTVTDFTEWVSPESGDAQLEVGSPRKPLVPKVRRGEAA